MQIIALYLDQSIAFQQCFGIQWASPESFKKLLRMEGVTSGQDVFAEILRGFLVKYAFFFKQTPGICFQSFCPFV